MKGNRSQIGFTLIEALIALVVLSIGLLGVAAMQLKALQSAHMGYQRSVVSLAAIDAQERAWEKLSKSNPKTCPSDSDIEGDWKTEWFGKILADAGSSIVSPSNCNYIVTIAWQEGRFMDEEDLEPFIYLFRLPEL
ncbi:type IV pilus modification PilV family protein [Billgrantia montanilacus]|uniref:Prepilin-type N-terminal cleavage/methylation domain-containing protein n=1 Tax=Billgrantia montanilacus TaxID=2282305 RepID=A0A368TRY0_9GAMM|nr:prepilin-type N-terminal cleavage/methylation domain-containing protein [Halomonas montanilacus]RCV87096.1 prepilin-type N-terminal cleavage/methylation domain-containing protein [Halomonas montanilacus]